MSVTVVVSSQVVDKNIMKSLRLEHPHVNFVVCNQVVNNAQCNTMMKSQESSAVMRNEFLRDSNRLCPDKIDKSSIPKVITHFSFIAR